MHSKTGMIFLLLLAFINAECIYGIHAKKQVKDIPATPVFSPYVDICLYPYFDISNTDSTKICIYTLSFIVDDESEPGANPCWCGYGEYDMTYYQEQISELRSKGGDIIISFGGASGKELASVAGDTKELTDAYIKVIDAYQARSIDFDIEGSDIGNIGIIERRSAAIGNLRQAYPYLEISVTLPVMPMGLTQDGINVIKSGIRHGFDYDIVNIMTMDYGTGGDMGENAINAINSTFEQLRKIYSEGGIDRHDTAIWRMIGVTPMIGQNDIPSEVFTLEDAEELREFVYRKKTGRISFWSANRDAACQSGTEPLYICSHVQQTLFEFTHILSNYGKESSCLHTGINSRQPVETEVLIYPNPSGDYVNVYSKSCNPIRFILYDINGRKIKEVSDLRNRISISHLHSGVYYAEINSRYYRLVKL